VADDFAEEQMLHTVLIILHATTALVCFGAGVLSLGLQTATSGRFRLYFWSLLAMLVFMAGAIAVRWVDVELSARSIFLGLGALGIYMAYRAGRAGTRLRRHDQDWRPRYLDDIGFTLISLFDGFVIVAAIDLGAPVWLVVLIAVAGVAGGVQAMKRVKTRLVG
jgi:hypothetical protein